ncbi:MAG TPA: serine/threonine-protein kinase, partial [Lacipirellulaceae bacterium]|nr:serine/threonine-protein kinase [Lacipirellulaceae bacterium]
LTRLVAVCNAMEYAHNRGIIHRDLKPSNIMLGRFGETLVVDWGLAKPIGAGGVGEVEQPLQPISADGSTATQLGRVVGTPMYMSPEQAGGRIDQLGPATDVYSLGATLYQVLTGQAPFAAAGRDTVLIKVERGDFPRPRRIRSV